MKKVTDVLEIDELFAEAREAGIPILAPNFESFTELLAELVAAQAIADRYGLKRVPIMPSITLGYPDRGNVAGRGGAYQDFSTTLTQRYTQDELDAFLKFGFHVSNHDIDCFAETSWFPNVHAIFTIDHGQPQGDRSLLEDTDVLKNVGVVMYDVTELLKRNRELRDDRDAAVTAMAETAAEYREKFGDYVRIESACDILPEAPGEGSLPDVEDTLTHPDEMEQFLSISGVDFFAPSIGTEHRARNPEGPEKLYREELVRQLHTRVSGMERYEDVDGSIFSLHGSSCLDPSSEENDDLYAKLHGMVIFRYYTGLSSNQGEALKRWVEDGDRRVAAEPKEGLHVNASSGRDWFLVEQLQPELQQVMANIGYAQLGSGAAVAEPVDETPDEEMDAAIGVDEVAATDEDAVSAEPEPSALLPALELGDEEEPESEDLDAEDEDSEDDDVEASEGDEDEEDSDDGEPDGDEFADDDDEVDEEAEEEEDGDVEESEVALDSEDEDDDDEISDDAPILWIPPDGFDEEAVGLGLPQLEGVSHRIIYNPAPSKANTDEGGDGVYESLEHGTFCHGPNFIIVGDHIVASWSNHTMDESGPGKRSIARVGKIIDGGEEIEWGSLSEITAPPIPPRRRLLSGDPERLGPYAGGGLQLINGKIYVMGSMHSAVGFTNAEEYRLTTGPIAEENFNDGVDVEAGFDFDKWAPLGFSFVQGWRIDENDELVPDSPLYQRTPFVDRFEVTPGRFKTAVPDLQAPYDSALPFSEASDEFRADVLNGAPVSFGRSPKFAPGEAHIAADGINALAHAAEFQRPDGMWVSLRDNLLNPGYYYASLKENQSDYYPPAYETNLYAGANPAAGEMPDGRPWIICNSYDDYYRAADRSRKDMYITLSDDGVVFDRTWLILHVDGDPDGGVYKFGGPQYFKPLILGSNLWVFYSITKMKIGLTKMPLAVFG